MDQGFSLRLTQFLLQSRQHLIAVAHEFDLTSQQAMTLLMIDNTVPKPMGSYCKLYDCDASNLTGIVDGLETKGLMTRQNDPQDRRVKVLRIEPKGESVRAALIERMDESLGNSLLQALSAAEMQRFVELITKINTQK
jgi:DNA-binding MarR family transcriptional regulator